MCSRVGLFLDLKLLPSVHIASEFLVMGSAVKSFNLTLVSRNAFPLLGAFLAYFGEGSGLLLRGMSCTGTETSVTECTLGQYNCQRLRNFGVICQGIKISEIMMSS